MLSRLRLAFSEELSVVLQISVREQYCRGVAATAALHRTQKSAPEAQPKASSNKKSQWRSSAPADRDRKQPRQPPANFTYSALEAGHDPDVVPAWSAHDRQAIASALNAVFGDPQLHELAPRHNISTAALLEHKKAFARWLYRRLTLSTKRFLLSMHVRRRLVPAVWPVLQEYLLKHHASDVTKYGSALRTADMRQPHTWYAMANGLNRRVVYHAGPTNSGKTYQALQALKQAGTGIYCGPLRLLAVEVADRLNAEGVPCDTLTGQESIHIPASRHLSCTVEMAPTDSIYDVAVIDEIQMIADPARGWAWARALLGLPAHEIHVCGDHSCISVVERLCGQAYMPCEVQKYERLTSLELDQKGLAKAGYRGLQAGDAVIAFARKDLYRIKGLIEAQTSHRVAIIYGKLPPAVRRHQAALFNDPASEYTVLVASDAIGMGLNLNIRRIIFHTVYRYDAVANARVPLSPSHLKQIAGRAGRKGTDHEEGFATTKDPADLKLLEAALNLPIESETLVAHAAGLKPEVEQVEAYAELRGYPQSCEFSEVLEHFAYEARQEQGYFFCNQEAVLELAKATDALHDLMSLKERWLFCTAPVPTKNPMVLEHYLSFARRYAEAGVVDINVDVPCRPPNTIAELTQCESAYQAIDIWLWLSQRVSEAFPSAIDVRAAQDRISELISEGLRDVSLRKRDRREEAMNASHIALDRMFQEIVKLTPSAAVRTELAQELEDAPDARQA